MSPLLATLLLAGCGEGPDEQSTADDQALLDEMLGDLTSGSAGATQTVSLSDSASPAEPSAPAVARAAGDRLELRLQAGDRFPLIKTVEQTLVQKSTSAPFTARTRLEMTLALQVEAVEAEFVQMNVRYSRISYSHDLGGNRMEFDSASHQGVVPQDAVPYAGMVGNGFSFQIGRDNRIQKLIGYQEFLERCVQQIPLERRQSLLAEIGQRFGDDGVANFIDDTIGLLPYNADVAPEKATNVIVGDVWTRERRLMQPVPVYLTSTYRLVDLNRETAEIEITGRIASGTSVQAGAVRIKGGQAIGSCSLDRDTGLPLELDVTQFISLTALDTNHQEVVQEKQVRTMIRTFPETRRPVVQSPMMQQGVIPAGATLDAAGGAGPIPTGTTTATYPD